MYKFSQNIVWSGITNVKIIKNIITAVGMVRVSVVMVVVSYKVILCERVQY